MLSFETSFEVKLDPASRTEKLWHGVLKNVIEIKINLKKKKIRKPNLKKRKRKRKNGTDANSPL